MNFIERVELDPYLEGLGVIVVTDANGTQTRYLSKEGVLYPGRVWRSSTDTHSVTFFIPFPDGTPVVLKVEAL